MSGSAFARAYLEKLGWEPGKGLGKEESGIQKAVQVTLKQDVRGVGSTENWGDQWWDRAFNSASAALVVATSSGGDVELSRASDAPKAAPKKPASSERLYGAFVKSGAVAEMALKSETSAGSVAALTDEELLRACEGRTARKGARCDQLGKVSRGDRSGALERIAREKLANRALEPLEGPSGLVRKALPDDRRDRKALRDERRDRKAERARIRAARAHRRTTAV